MTMSIKRNTHPPRTALTRLHEGLIDDYLVAVADAPDMSPEDLASATLAFNAALVVADHLDELCSLTAAGFDEVFATSESLIAYAAAISGPRCRARNTTPLSN
jgi:hypothetical protein